MFIKILTPNHNGKIELTVADLEALIQEAVDKAIREKCAGCNKHYGGFTYLCNGQSIESEKTYEQPKILYSSSAGSIGISNYANTNDWENKE